MNKVTNQGQSNQIKPVRGKYLWYMELHGSENRVWQGLGVENKDCEGPRMTKATNQGQSNRIKSNQIESNRIKSNQIESNRIKPNQTKSNL
jgi:hypothetical protein